MEADIGESKNVAGANSTVVEKIMEFADAGVADIGDFYNIGTGERQVPRKEVK